jgi:CDP-paratose 2-epimerase
LEATRSHSTSIPFVHLSTNKVYGDGPNLISLKELNTRWDYADSKYQNGIPETFSIDQTKHSLFGASKVSADISVQEYGRYFNMPTVCLRGGCLTGPNHSGVELHGFLSYLIRCNLEQKEYTVFGYKGKQVRDNIHSYDVARFIEEFIDAPRMGEVYNIGGGKENTCSILEAFSLISEISGIEMRWKYNENNRIGDHICYYSDLRKMKEHYPNWTITKTLKNTFEEIYEAWMSKKR